MTVEPYPAYKASGVEWLGSIPETWSVERIRRRTRLRTDKAVDASLKVALENVESWTGRFIDTEDADYSGEGIAFARGDVLFGKLRPYLAKAWRADSEGAAIGDFHVYSLGSDTNPRFFQYMILSGDFISLVDGSTYGAKMPRASWDFIGNLLEVFPPLDEQRQIADYLDIHMAKIDTLIGKQEQLIETLTERRQALISHAVTKGLDPNVPMKDSGVGWVGMVPASWSLKRVSWLFSLVGSGTTPPSDDERFYGAGTPWVTTGELREGTITETTKSVTQAATSKFPTLRVYEPGTLLIAMYGATIGRLAVLGVPACTNQACCAMSLPVDVLTRYAFYSLLAAKEHILVLAVGGGQPNINQEMLRALRLPTPPISEQDAIVYFLDRETDQIDALSAKAREMIDVLRERRQALISAAVTGKIDVRGLS